MVRLTEPPWRPEQISEAVKAQLQLAPQGIPEPIALAHFQLVSNAVAAANSGIRWILYEEVKLPDYYRLDIRDFLNSEPVVDSAVMYSNISGVFHINNYSRKEVPYKEASKFQGIVILDNSSKPIRWAQENLFAAKYLEGAAAAPIVLLLEAGITKTEQQRLFGEMRLENMNLFQKLRLDEGSLKALVAGSREGYLLRVVQGAVTNQYTIELTVENAASGRMTGQWLIDESLPYLVQKVVLKANGAEYVSERLGLADLGFPAVWRVLERDAKGIAKGREVRVLSARTNIAFAAAVITNFSDAAQVWERFGTGQMRPLAGVTSHVIEPILPAAFRSQTSTRGHRQGLALVMLLLPTIAFLFVFAARHRQRHNAGNPARAARRIL